MAYTDLGIVNYALQKLGIKAITASDWATPITEQAKAAKIAWEFVKKEVLEAKDWKFAKTRIFLGKGGEIDNELKMGFLYAYQMPGYFLRLAKPTKTSTKSDPPVYPPGYDYKIEVVATDTGDVFCLLIDYDNSREDLYIVCIKKQDTVSLWSGSFVNAFAFRLAAEIAITRTELRERYGDMMNFYEIALSKADSLNQASDYLENEIGSDEWVNAGRN